MYASTVNSGSEILKNEDQSSLNRLSASSATKNLDDQTLCKEKYHKGYQCGHKIRNRFSVPKMAAVYHRYC